jgi:hypothetical protein
MWRFRFHLGTLVILVLILGIGLAALRESNEIWDSGVFSITLGMLSISILLAIHRTESRRAFWLGFALFGSGYLGFSLVPPIESRLITTKALAFLDSKVPRSIPAGLVYADFDNDGKMDFYVVNQAQPNVLYPNKSSLVFEDVTATVGLNPGNQATSNGTLLLNNSAGLGLRGSGGTSENFMRIGQSLLALTLAFVGSQLSRRLYGKKRIPAQGTASPQRSNSDGSGDRVDG